MQNLDPNQLLQRAQQTVDWGLWALGAAARLVVAVSTAFATATVLYAALYAVVVPETLHERTVYFDYGAEGGRPAAAVQLLAAHSSWMPGARHDVQPAPRERLLAAGQAYDLSVTLQLADSHHNREHVGMFTVYAEVLDAQGDLLARSARPLLVPHQSLPVRWGRDLLWAVPTILGFAREEQVSVVPAFDGFVELPDAPAAELCLTLSDPTVQLLGARVAVSARLSGLSYLMHTWFLSTATVVISQIAGMELVVGAIVYAIRQARAAEERLQPALVSLRSVPPPLPVRLPALDGGGGGGGVAGAAAGAGAGAAGAAAGEAKAEGKPEEKGGLRQRRPLNLN